MNNSDYSKKRTNLNDLIPNQNKSKFLETINENLFNRHLTKPEVVRYIGNVGDVDSNDVSIKNIKEPTEFRQKNQLQPIVQHKTGTVKNFLSFQEFLSKLEGSGVDIDSLDVWAKLQQFNWAPPIDFDKLINYRDYFWTNNDFSPDYITIKNKFLQSYSRLEKSFDSIFDILDTYEVFSYSGNSIQIKGNYTSVFTTDQKIIIKSNTNDFIISKVVNSSYSNGSFRTTIYIEDTIEYDINFVAISDIRNIQVDVLNSTFTIDKDVTSILKPGYIFSVFDQVDILLKIETSQFNTQTNKTIITVENFPDFSTVPTSINILPLIYFLVGEKNSNSFDEKFIYYPESWDISSLRYLNSKNIFLTESINGSTILGQDIINDPSVNFFSVNVSTGDTIIINSGVNSGEYEITQVFENDIRVNKKLFSQSNIDFTIIKHTRIDSVESIHRVNYLRYVQSFDTLEIFDGNYWVTVLQNASLLISLINDQNCDEYINDWSKNNYWLHKDLVKDTTDFTRAQLPIIEYDECVELSDTSLATHEWDYRKDANSSYSITDIEPNLFELHDIKLINGNEFYFEDYFTIIFNEKYGNFLDNVEVGSEVVLSGFLENDGIYTIKQKDFLKLDTSNRYVTKLQLEQPLSDISDLEINSRISPRLTSVGDIFNYEAQQWRFKGVKNITSSSYFWQKNPQIDELVSSFEDSNYAEKIYLNSYEINFKNEVSDQYIELPDILKNVVLYDDYQEGDIRVYINGVRQYANFADVDTNDDDYIDGIVFQGITLSTDDVVRIEVGEYFYEDIGRRDVLLNTPAGPEKYNLTRLRKIEQKRYEPNQYPLFKLYNCDGTQYEKASELFKYIEAEDMPVNPYIFKRIKFDFTNRNFYFENLLESESQDLYAYKNSGILKTIWASGENGENVVPQKIGDEWDIIDPWFFNVEHENRKNVSLSDIFTHFNTCIEKQGKNSVFFSDKHSDYYLINNKNKILGGTIKEHNHGLDNLISANFSNSTVPTNIFYFAASQYQYALNYIKDFYKNSISSSIINPLLLNSESLLNNFISSVSNDFENNDYFNELYGDSLNTSIKNFISSATALGIFKSVTPHLISDENGETLLVHHTGHISKIIFTSAEKEQIINKIPNKIFQTVSLTTEAFPVAQNPNEILIRTDLQEKTRKIYKSSDVLQWFEIDLLNILSNILLDVEKKLYTDCQQYNSRYDFSDILSNDLYFSFSKEQFFKYCSLNNINKPLSLQNVFKNNDSFTWNYYYTSIPVHPKTGLVDDNRFGCWQALYEYVYGTAYPHRQPWILQGYSNKPDWWDSEYLNSDPLIPRYWKKIMWLNIFSGIVPSGYMLPDDSISSGAANEITPFIFLPINITDSITNDGYLIDDLLPPYWNSSNTNDIRVRTIFDINSGYGVNTPNIDFEFGQNGTNEWLWKNSIYFNYDLLTIAYKLDPIKLFDSIFDSDFNVVDCLRVDKKLNKVRNHKIINFHGELINDEIYKSSGVSQWYTFFNRYNNIDGNVSNFLEIWKNWDQKLSYLFSGMIDINNFEIFNRNFDITDRDYEIEIDKFISFDKKEMTGFNATLLSVPSKYNKFRDNGLGWTTEFTPLTDATSIEIYEPQLFNVRRINNSNVFSVSDYQLDSAEILRPNGYQIIDLSQTVFNSLNTGLPNTTQQFSCEITFDSAQTINVNIKGNKAQTYSDLLKEINKIISEYGYAEFYYGDIRIVSNTEAGASAVSITDFGLFASLNNFSSILAPDVGQYEFSKIFYVYGNLLNEFIIESKFTITDSTQFNGEYTILNATYDPRTQLTKIFVKEDIELINSTVDGIIKHENARTLPDNWVTGVELFLDTSGILPSPLDQFTPYYLIRINESSFSLSNTYEGSIKNVSITVTTNGSGQHSIGKLKRTFKALSGNKSNYPWRIYEPDKRNKVKYIFPVQTSSIQEAVNFINGYNDKLEDDGIIFNNKDLDNKDKIFNRVNDWQFFIEKFISWAYEIRSIHQEDSLLFEVKANIYDNTLEIQNGAYVNWPNGTEIVFNKSNDAVLPVPFENPLSEYIPYYIIRTNSNNKIQLALSSYDAIKGNSIDISSNGDGKFFIRTVNPITDYPSIILNPCKHSFRISHNQGIISDIFNRVNYFFEEKPRIFDVNGELLTNNHLIVYRNDKESKISLLKSIIENNEKQFTYNKKVNEKDIVTTSVVLNNKFIEMSGFTLLLDSYEHIISFNNRSVVDSLIFDAFLGLKTPRFYMEYSKTPEFSRRPNAGGHILLDNQLVENLEHSVETLRYLYDTYTNVENRPIIERSRKSIGYEGNKDYMDDLQINDKSQFIFWRGMIQNKGTNTSIDAFVNQPIYEDAGVDEFWAYKVACFGDSKEKIYPELKMYTRDVNTKEMRVEFVTPDGAQIDSTFEAVKLTDVSRWWNQPDQIYSMTPRSTFYFDAEITSLSTSVENDIEDINNVLVFRLPKPADKVIVTYYDQIAQERKTLSENYEYYILNSNILVFNQLNSEWFDINVSTLSYHYDAQNPATLIDKQTRLLTNKVPIWNPAFDQHYHIANNIIDIRNEEDVAVYNFTETNPDETTWLANKKDLVWLDTSKMHYIPYYDSRIFPDINFRIFNWGRMADYGKIEIYQWTESLVPPSEWVNAVSSDRTNSNLLQSEKRSGEALYKIYRNEQETVDDEPLWVEHKDEVFSYVVRLVTEDLEISNTFDVDPKVYINGFYYGTLDLSEYSLREFCYGPLIDGQQTKPNMHDTITLVFEAVQPSEDELEEGFSFKREYPYSYKTYIDPISLQPYNVYYFWVKNKENKIKVMDDSYINLKEAKKQLQFIPVPYMILQGLRAPEFGYGLVYGTVFDEDEYQLPYRYTQLVVKGLENTVKDDERYSLRFTRDFTLRDRLPGPTSLYSPLYLKNVHWEWKLIREKQLSKIDLYLWDRVVESMIGKYFSNGVVGEKVIPTLNRVVYDQLYNADTRYGLGEEQTFIDGELAKNIVLGMLNDPNNIFVNVDINDFLEEYSLNSESEIVEMMYAIYNNFTIEEVNKIFFEILHAAMSLKKEHAEIFKTSWVALQGTQNVYVPSNSILRDQFLESSDYC